MEIGHETRSLLQQLEKQVLQQVVRNRGELRPVLNHIQHDLRQLSLYLSQPATAQPDAAAGTPAKQPDPDDTAAHPPQRRGETPAHRQATGTPQPHRPAGGDADESVV